MFNTTEIVQSFENGTYKIKENVDTSLTLNLEFDYTDMVVYVIYNKVTDFLFLFDWRPTPTVSYSLYNFSKLVKEDFHFQKMTKYDIPFSSEEITSIMEVLTCLSSQITTKVKTA